jgi:hypothetical protein
MGGFNSSAFSAAQAQVSATGGLTLVNGKLAVNIAASGGLTNISNALAVAVNDLIDNISIGVNSSTKLKVNNSSVSTGTGTANGNISGVNNTYSYINLTDSITNKVIRYGYSGASYNPSDTASTNILDNTLTMTAKFTGVFKITAQVYGTTDTTGYMPSFSIDINGTTYELHYSGTTGQLATFYTTISVGDTLTPSINIVNNNTVWENGYIQLYEIEEVY